MPIGTAMIIATETAKKVIQETAKQVTREAKKDVLKGMLKDAVKQEVKEEVKCKVREEIDENIVDTKAVDAIYSLSKHGSLKGKLQESLMRETKGDVIDSIVDTKATQVVSYGEEGFTTEGKTETHDMKKETGDISDKKESLGDKLHYAIDNSSDTENTSNLASNITEQKVENVTDLEKAENISDVQNKEGIQEAESNKTEKSAEKDIARTPENHGHWEGERGDSKWIPDGDYVPPEKSVNPEKPYSNPDKLSWKEIMNKYGIDGIPFKNGFPDFSEVSKGTVKIEGFETGGNVEKNRNFRKADIELAEQRGCSPDEIKKWREENNYTWHECEDKKTMQIVPNEVHANIPHDGGRSQ